MAGLSDDGMNVGGGMGQLAPWMMPPDEYQAPVSAHSNQAALQAAGTNRQTPPIAQNHVPPLSQQRADQQALYFHQNSQQQLYQQAPALSQATAAIKQEYKAPKNSVRTIDEHQVSYNISINLF